MSVERESYEAGWRYCARCGTRRPSHALTNGECTERAWCERHNLNCRVCGLPVPQPVSRGRPRTRHVGECEAQARKLARSGVET